MTRYLLRRTGLLILTGSAALVAIFVLLRLLPGDPANALVSGTATPEQIEATRKEIVDLVKDAPLFADEWMGDSEN